MEKCRIQLRNSILGWGLFPVSEGSEKVLTKLYCQDYETLRRKEVCCLRGTVKEVLAEVKKVAGEMGMRVSACGKKGAPTLRVWEPKPEAELSGEVNVDLKWSLWSQDQKLWEEYAPGIWERMRDAFLGKTGPLVIRTAPRKEIHFGTVTVSRGAANGVFTTEWDDVEGLAETLGAKCDDAFRSWLPYTVENMAPGVALDFNLKARKFGLLMRRIDDENSSLLEKDEKIWKYLEECFRRDGGK